MQTLSIINSKNAAKNEGFSELTPMSTQLTAIKSGKI